MSAISWAWKAEQSPPLEYTRNFAPDKQFLMVLIFFNVLENIVRIMITIR